MTDEEYMKKALQQALCAAKKDEVPVGAVVVEHKSGKIISRAHNLTEHFKDCTAHAEILAIQRACKKLKSNRLWGMDLYVTLEPCTMCAAAISYSRIENLYFGAFDEKNGAISSGIKFYEQPICHHKPAYSGGILADECSKILKMFFLQKRNK